jgi:hypothetical protein
MTTQPARVEETASRQFDGLTDRAPKFCTYCHAPLVFDLDTWLCPVEGIRFHARPAWGRGTRK